MFSFTVELVRLWFKLILYKKFHVSVLTFAYIKMMVFHVTIWLAKMTISNEVIQLHVNVVHWCCTNYLKSKCVVSQTCTLNLFVRLTSLLASSLRFMVFLFFIGNFSFLQNTFFLLCSLYHHKNQIWCNVEI